MTDRWETENSDGWQSMDCSAIRFLHLRGGIPPSKKQQFYICHRPVGLLTCRLYGRHTCKLYSLLAHKFDKPTYCLPMLWQSRRLQTTNWNFRLVFFWTQQGMFSAAPNVLSCFKLDIRRNMARYVLSNSKPSGLLPKTLPHSANFSLRSREIWVSLDKITMFFYVCWHSRPSISN